MISGILATISLIVLSGSAVIQIFFLLKNKKDPFSHFIILVATVLLLITLIMRSVQINFIAVTNTFESMLFYTTAIGAALFTYRLLIKDKTMPVVVFGGTILQIMLLAVASSPIAPQEIVPPIPALQSGWLVLHVTFAFIGEAFFAVSFIAAVYYLLAKDEELKKKLDRLIYHAVAIGYPVYTAGALIFGAIWAEKAWGAFWSWDPKETWALITWITYTLFLHSRFLKTFRGTFTAVFSIVGFAFTIFTLFGVNFLLPGLHGYIGQ